MRGADPAEEERHYQQAIAVARQQSARSLKLRATIFTLSQKASPRHLTVKKRSISQRQSQFIRAGGRPSDKDCAGDNILELVQHEACESLAGDQHVYPFSTT